MKIYQVEKQDNLEENIAANTSIAYHTDIIQQEPRIKSLRDLEIAENIIKSSIKDNELYYHTSILVTTSWNLNDDVFTPGTVWEAKNTPVHKPTNIEHDSMKIVGHMTGSWAIDEDGELIEADKDITKLPSKFHILAGSVIYKKWHSNTEYEKIIAELIEKIEAGEKYVSMEAIFKDFDYILEDNKNSDYRIIARNEDTAFLSKYLRAYGGDGYFQETKIGRVVKNISFCGNGYVDKPANPESVIFTKDNIFDFAKAKFVEKNIISEKSGVVSSTNKILCSEEQNIMSDFYKEQYDAVKMQNETLAKSLDEMKEKVAQSNLTKLEKDIEKLTAKTVDMDTVIKSKNDELAAKIAELEEVNKKFSELSKTNDELAKSNKELSDKFTQIEAANKLTSRLSLLIAGGFNTTEADEKVKVFEALSDEQFGLVAQELIKVKKLESTNTENPSNTNAGDLENTEITNEEVASASIEDQNVDITDIAKKLSNMFNRKKDGDK